MRKIRFASIYLFTLALVFFVLGAFIEWHIIVTINRINNKLLGDPKYLHLILYLLGFLGLCSIYFIEKREVKILSLANTELQKEIEKRNDMKEALQGSEERYRDIFENISDFLYFHDLEGYFTDVNLAFKKESGYGHEEMSTLNIMDLLPEAYKHMAKDYFKRVIENGRDEGLMRVMAKDGRELIVEYRNSLVYDSTGPIGIRGSARDITKRKQAEIALRESEERYSAVVKQASEGIYLLDPETKKIMESNSSFCKMTGTSPKR